MKALVLCAGRGTRLGSLTQECPKALLSLHGKPLIHYILSYLKLQGIDEVGVNLHYRAQEIQDYCLQGQRWGLSIHYSYEEQMLGTLGALRPFKNWLSGDENFLLSYGDILTDQSLQPLWKLHLQNKALATLLVHQRVSSNSMIYFNEAQRVTFFKERPSEDEKQQILQTHGKNFFVNSGVQILHKKIFDYVNDGMPCDLARDCYSQAYEQSVIYGVPLTGQRVAIDSPERYALACDYIEKKTFQWMRK